jgi:hypothetical protein
MQTTAEQALERIINIARAALTGTHLEAATREAYTLRRQDGLYVLRWQNAESVHRHTRGLDYIAALIESPRRVWPVCELFQHVTGEQPPEDAGQEVIDAETKTRIGRRLREIALALEDADEAEAEALTDERRKLAEYVSEAAGRQGKTRRTGDEVERIRQQIDHAIRRAIAAIATTCPAGANHLRRSITGGRAYCYDSELISPALA